VRSDLEDDLARLQRDLRVQKEEEAARERGEVTSLLQCCSAAMQPP